MFGNTAEKKEESPVQRFTSSSFYEEDSNENSRGKSRRLMISLIAVSAFLAFVAYSYVQSRQTGGEAVVATIEAKTPYTRIRPDDPQGADAPYQDMDVYNRVNTTADDAKGAAATLAPLPEQPMIKSASPENTELSVTDAANAAEEEAIAATEDKTADIPQAIPAVKPQAGISAEVQQAQTVLKQVATEKKAAVQPLKINKNTTVEKVKKVAVPTADEEGAEAVAEVKTAAPLPVKKVSTIGQSKTPKPAPVVTTTAPAAGGAVKIQLAAFSSEQLAQNGWKTLSQKHAGLLGGLDPVVTRVNINGKTLYRLQASSISSAAAATSLCGKLKAAGQSCMVAK